MINSPEMFMQFITGIIDKTNGVQDHQFGLVVPEF